MPIQSAIYPTNTRVKIKTKEKGNERTGTVIKGTLNSDRRLVQLETGLIDTFSISELEKISKERKY